MEDESGLELERGKEAREYLATLRRYKSQIVAVAAVLAVISFIVALALPPVYRSSATILVQEQEVPPDLVRSTITSFADERIQVISQQIMTRAVLLDLVEKHDLYRKYRDRATVDEILDRIRKDIKLSTVNADISDRRSGQRVNATIAFKISYDAPDPERAQKVADELVSLYLNENVKVRQQSVAETNAFLAQEADRLAGQMKAIEAKLADFKRRNVGRMPDSSAVNVQLAERTESELQRVEREMSLGQDRKLSLEAQLSVISPNVAPVAGAGDRVQSSEERLRSLRAQYASVSSRYGPDHPDVRRLQREIAALGAHAGTTENAESLKKLEAEFVVLRDRYGDDHPDVLRVKRSIAALKASDVKASTGSSVPDKGRIADALQTADNPAYIVLAAQLESTKRELAQLAALRDDLKAKQRSYDARLLQIPEVEREYAELTRDYSNAQTRYREIKAKQMQAEGAMELEKDSKAERFSLGEPANLPQTPFSPNRPAIALIGLIASVGGGLGIALLRDAIDPSVKGPRELVRIVRFPILTAIPYIETQADRVGRRRRSLAQAGAYLAMGLILVLGVHFLAKPIPALVGSVVHKITIW